MVRKLVALLMLALPAAASAEGVWTEWSGPVTIHRVKAPVLGAPAAGVPSNADSGSAAALELERALRGRKVNSAAENIYVFNPNAPQTWYLPDASPVPMDPNHIVEMTPNLWTIPQLLADFKLNGNGKKGFIILLKTEYCHKNKLRLCSVTTAALSKASTPLLSRFHIYGAWLGYLNPKSSDPRYAAWQKAVEEEYEFDQGPGSNIYVLFPDPSAPHGFSGKYSTAVRLGLYSRPFEAAGGETPELHRELERALLDSPK